MRNPTVSESAGISVSLAEIWEISQPSEIRTLGLHRPDGSPLSPITIVGAYASRARVSSGPLIMRTLGGVWCPRVRVRAYCAFKYREAGSIGHLDLCNTGRGFAANHRETLFMRCSSAKPSSTDRLRAWLIAQYVFQFALLFQVTSVYRSSGRFDR